MSAYDNDPRVAKRRTGDWAVSATCGVVYIVDVANDGLHYAWAPDGRLLASISGHDFDTVVHALIGDPR